MEESERPKQEVNAIEEGNQNPTKERDTELQEFCNPTAIMLLSDQAKQDINFLSDLKVVLQLNLTRATLSLQNMQYQMQKAEAWLDELTIKKEYLSRLMEEYTLAQSTISAEPKQNTKSSEKNLESPSSTSPSKNATVDTNFQTVKYIKGSKKNTKSDGITATIPTENDDGWTSDPNIKGKKT